MTIKKLTRVTLGELALEGAADRLALARSNGSDDVIEGAKQDLHREAMSFAFTVERETRGASSDIAPPPPAAEKKPRKPRAPKVQSETLPGAPTNGRADGSYPDHEEGTNDVRTHA